MAAPSGGNQEAEGTEALSYLHRELTVRHSRDWSSRQA